jgi:hypothetical protein
VNVQAMLRDAVTPEHVRAVPRFKLVDLEAMTLFFTLDMPPEVIEYP